MADLRYPSLAIHFARANSWFDEALQLNLRSRGLSNTSHTQGLVMGYVGLGIRRPSRIARIVGVSPQAMNQALSELRQLGFIELVSDETDRRARVVRFTPAGAAHSATARALLLALERELEARFGSDVIAAMRRVIGEDWGPPPLVASDEV